MDTQNNESKKKETFQSEMEFREKAHWKIGEDIITAVGGEEKKPIAYIRLEKYDENKKPILSCRDLDGNALSENTSNLYELKRGLKENEIELTQAMREKDQPEVEKSVDTPAQATEVIAKTQEPESPAKNPDQEKGTALKKARRSKAGKSKENEQTISH